MDAITDIINAIVLLLNFIIVPGLAYGSQLALGALGVTLVFGILRFANFAHGDTMAFGTMVTILATWWLQSPDKFHVVLYHAKGITLVAIEFDDSVTYLS